MQRRSKNLLLDRQLQKSIHRKLATFLADLRPADEEEVEQAVLLLQYLLRGRAIQTLMYEGKERRKELIGELKSAEDYKDVEIKPPTTTDSEVRKAHKQKKVLERRRREAEGIFDDALGYIIGASLDFLSKELVRVQVTWTIF